MDDTQNVPVQADENGMSPTPVEETKKPEEETPAADVMPETPTEEMPSQA